MGAENEEHSLGRYVVLGRPHLPLTKAGFFMGQVKKNNEGMFEGKGGDESKTQGPLGV